MTKPDKKILFEAVVTALALLLLVFALLYYNVFNKNEAVKTYGIGNKCFNFEAVLYESAGCDGGVYTPKNSIGQVTVLNFWYTTCAACVKELPHFNEVQQEYGDKITVIAIHSSTADSDVDKQQFINSNFSDYVILFAQDTQSFKIYERLGGKMAWPMTVILDKQGTIRSVINKSLTYEQLKAEIDALL